MIGYLVFGITFAFAAAVQPGPLQAWLVARTLAHGWRRALPGAFSPLLSDGPIIALSILVLSRMPAWLLPAIRIAGGAVLLAFAVLAARDWRRAATGGPAPTGPPGSAPRSLLGAAAINFTSPGPYLGWSLVMGPLLLRGWRESPAHGVALLAGFYGTMVLAMALMVLAIGAARTLAPRANRALLGASALALAGLGVWQLVAGARALRAL